jgi:pyruvate/2-oxoglutarate dehydrogenase complex dihydrolipoamide acyltransferase (E2) component
VTRAAVALALLLAAPASARPPEVVRWEEAAGYVGRIIAVEGTVVNARVANGACALEFAPDDQSAFRVVLMLGLFGSPADPERLYTGRRVRASGRVQSFEGRPEMIIRRADQIELLDGTTTTSTTTSTAPTTPAPAAAPPTTPPSTSPPATVPAPAPAAGGATAPTVTEACVRARERLEAATRELAARNEDAARCLRPGTSRCREERDAVTRALEALPAHEAEADRACE